MARNDRFARLFRLLPTPDAATTDATTDPCMGIPASGVCSTSSSIDLCVYPEFGDPYVEALGALRLDAAMSSARMTQWPFLRGYTTPYGFNTTFFGDFLDALVCGGLNPGIVDAATEPRTYYPYASTNPHLYEAKR